MLDLTTSLKPSVRDAVLTSPVLTPEDMIFLCWWRLDLVLCLHGLLCFCISESRLTTMPYALCPHLSLTCKMSAARMSSTEWRLWTQTSSNSSQIGLGIIRICTWYHSVFDLRAVLVIHYTYFLSLHSCHRWERSKLWNSLIRAKSLIFHALMLSSLTYFVLITKYLGFPYCK